MTESKIYHDEISLADIIWIPTPVDGQIQDIAFVRVDDELVAVRLRKEA